MNEHLSFRFDWDEVLDQKITDILGLNAVTMTDGTARWDAVAICIGRSSVMLSVEPDTDQIIIAHEPSPSGNGWVRISSFNFALTKPLGWSWIGITSQGYKDSFTIAFGDVVPDALQPRCTFLAAASSLSCFDLIERCA